MDNLFKLLKEAGRMQEMVSAQQEELAKKEFTSEVGGGMVRAKVNGLMDVLSITAEADALDTLGLDSVLELAAAAVNEAIKKVREEVKGDMMSQFQNLAGGLLKDHDAT